MLPIVTAVPNTVPDRGYALNTYIFKRFIYLFIHERHREREKGRDTGRGRSKLHTGSLMWELIPGLQDHALG